MRLIRFVALCAVLVSLTACADEQDQNVDIDISIGAPTAPPTAPLPPPTNTGVILDKIEIISEKTVLGSNLTTTIDYRASVSGTNVTQTVSWKPVTGENGTAPTPGFTFTPSGSTAVFVVAHCGRYVISASTNQGGVEKTASILVRIEVNCVPASSGPGAFTLNDNHTCSVSALASISWTASTGATHYRIERKSWSTGSWMVVGSTTSRDFSQQVGRDADYYFRVIAIGHGGETLSSPAERLVCQALGNPPPPPPSGPTVSLQAIPNSITAGGTSTLHWTSSNATSCTKSSDSSSWSGSATLSGSANVVLAEVRTYTFTLTCTGPGGTASAVATVVVSGPACPSAIDYSPKGGTIAVGTVVNASVDSWTNTSACVPFWHSSDPSRLQVLGADDVVTIGGARYFAGPNAQFKGISAGSASGTVQTSIPVNWVNRSYTWFIVAADGLKSFGLEVPPKPLPRRNIYTDPGVSQVWPPHK